MFAFNKLQQLAMIPIFMLLFLSVIGMLQGYLTSYVQAHNIVWPVIAVQVANYFGVIYALTFAMFFISLRLAIHVMMLVTGSIINT